MAKELLNLHQKIIEIKRSVKFLKKENVNAGQHFNYVSSSQALVAIREAMNEQGVVIETRIKDAKHAPFTGRDGWVFTELTPEYTIVNADNPDDRIVCQWYGQGLDNSEKGVGKALTYAEKYFVLKFFNIPTDKDDPDADPDAAPARQSKPARRQPEQPQKAQSEHKQTTNQDKPQASPDRPMSDKQRGAIFAIAKRSEIDEQLLDEFIMKKFSKSISVLNSAEASQTITTLQNSDYDMIESFVRDAAGGGQEPEFEEAEDDLPF